MNQKQFEEEYKEMNKELIKKPDPLWYKALPWMYGAACVAFLIVMMRWGWFILERVAYYINKFL